MRLPHAAIIAALATLALCAPAAEPTTIASQPTLLPSTASPTAPAAQAAPFDLVPQLVHGATAAHSVVAPLSTSVGESAPAQPTTEASSGKPSKSQCATQTSGDEPTNYWGVYEINGMMPSAQGTGDYAGGFLDNLRGRCGDIENWQAVPDGHGGIATTFNAKKSCMGADIAAALHVSMLGQEDWIMCVGDTFNGLLDYEQKVEQETMQYMSEVLGAVSAFIPK